MLVLREGCSFASVSPRITTLLSLRQDKKRIHLPHSLYELCHWLIQIIHLLGEELERHFPAVENGPVEGASNVQETQLPLPEVSNSSHLEDDRLLARARAVGVDYEFAKPGEVETEDDRRKRERRNQRRISEQEKRLREVVEHLPPPPPAGSTQQEDNAYRAIRAFELEKMTCILFLGGLQGKATGVQGHEKHVYSLQKR